ncbi:MAG: nucleotidyltransferase family protein [Gammaproteobacteria bacterium]
MTEAHSSEKSVALKRASGRQWVLKPQDLAVALKLVALEGRWLPYAALSEAMRLSRFEAHAAVQRLMAAGLVAQVGATPAPVLAALRSFVMFGAPYAYPPVRGGMTRGFPTAHGAAPLKDLLAPAAEPPPVWPHPRGTARGPGLLALYENLPLAAGDDPALYALLALFDALRAGRARERQLASAELDKLLGGASAPKENEAVDNQDRLIIGRTIAVSRAELRDLARRYHISRLVLFGSAARGELLPDSDIDLLVEFESGAAPSLGGMVEIEDAFSTLFGGRKVDLATPSIFNNPYRRRTIEKDMEELYAA